MWVRFPPAAPSFRGVYPDRIYRGHAPIERSEHRGLAQFRPEDDQPLAEARVQ